MKSIAKDISPTASIHGQGLKDHLILVYNNDLVLEDNINGSCYKILGIDVSKLMNCPAKKLVELADDGQKSYAVEILNKLYEASKEKENIYFGISLQDNKSCNKFTNIYFIEYGENGKHILLNIIETNIVENNKLDTDDVVDSFMSELLNNLNVGITLAHISKDGKKHFIFSNNLVTTKYGLDFQHSPHWDDPLDDRKNHELLNSNSSSIIFEFQIPNSDNWHDSWVRVHKKQFTATNGERYIITSSINITPYKHEEENLKQAYSDLKIALNSTNLLLWYYDVEADTFHHLYNGKYKDTRLSFEGNLKLFHDRDQILVRNLFSKLISQTTTEGEIIVRQFKSAISDYGYVQMWCGVVKDHDGKVIKIIGTQHDVSEIKKTKNRLRQQYNYLQAIYRGLPVGLIGCAEDGRIIFANNKAKDILGVEPDEHFEGLSIFEHSVVGNELKEATLSSSKMNDEIDIDVTLNCQILNRKPFEPKYVHVKGVKIKDDDELSNGFILVYEDHTEKVRINRELERQRLLLSTIYNNVPVGIELYDEKGILIDINPYDLELFGLKSKEAVLGISIFDEPNMKEATKEKLRKGLTFDITEEQYDFDKVNAYYETCHQGKKYIKLQYVTLKNEDAIMGYIVTNTDITDQKQTAQYMETMQKRLLLSLEAGNVITWSFDNTKKEFTTLLGSRNYKSGFVFSQEEVYDRIVPAQRDEVINLVNDILSGKKSKGEMLIKIFDHHKEDFQFVETLVVADKESPNIITGTFHDVTEKKKNALILENSRKSLTSAMSAIPMMAWDYDMITHKYYILLGNSYYRQKINPNGTLEKSHLDIHPDDRKTFYELQKKVAYEGSEKESMDVRFCWDHKNEYRNYEIIFQNTKDKNGKVTHLLGTYIDITDRIKQQRVDREMRTSLELVLMSEDLIVWKYDIKNDKFISLLGAKYIEKYNLSGICSTLIKEDKGKIKKMFNDIITHKANQRSATLSLDLHKKGNNKYFQFELTYLPNLRGEIDYLIGTQRDVTKDVLKEIELEKNRYEIQDLNVMLGSILDQSPCGMFIKDLDNDRRYLMANSFFCQKIQKPFSEFKGKNDEEIFSEHDANECRKGDDIAIESGKPYSYIEEVNWTGTPLTWYSTKLSIHTPNNKNLLIGVLLDITEREKARKELIVAKEKAEESDKLKSAFLANMSHEIRTPLNAIVGFSELLADTDITQEDKQEYLQIIMSNNEMLLRLINDVLDLSKMEAGMINLKSEIVDIEEDYQDLVKYFSLKLKDSLVDFRGKSPYTKCVVVTDKNRLKQIATNFLTNAIKYTKSGYIELRYEYINDGIRIEVEDTGKGISKEGQTKVFKRFEKLNSFVQGTGLGLSICKAIVEAQGGNIGVESKIGEGSTFWAWIPCKSVDIILKNK